MSTGLALEADNVVVVPPIGAKQVAVTSGLIRRWQYWWR